MKKLFTLVAIAAAPVVLSAQSLVSQSTGLKPTPLKSTVKVTNKPKLVSGNEDYSKINVNSASKPAKVARKATSVTSEPIGVTFYDLQTNVSVCRRVVLHPSGEVSAIWTFSAQANDRFTDRGTGYNNKPVGGTWGDAPDERFEPRRCGWPNITFDSNGDEIIASHNAEPTGGSIVDTTFTLVRNSKENRRTVERYTPLGAGRSVIWNRSAASSDGTNDYLYIINNWNTAGGGEPHTEPETGVTNMTYYSRAVYPANSGGGDVFQDTMVFLPGYDSTRFPNSGGDAYAIDAKDSIVAIVIGNENTDVGLWVSTKYGAPGTFTKFTVDSNPAAPYVGQGTNGDTIEVSVGDFSVLVGNDGNIHVFYPTQIAYADSGNALESFINNALYHWDLASGTKTLCGEAPDLDGDGEVTLSSDYNGIGYASFNAVRHPSAGMDAQGNLYLAFEAINELDTTVPEFSNFPGRNFSDIFLTVSKDSGKTWSIPENITNPDNANPNFEDVYPSMARSVDGNVHVVYQSDSEPGSFVTSLSGGSGGSQTENTIFYFARTSVTGIQNQKGTLSGVVMNAYPNPANQQVTFEVKSEQNMNAQLTLRNMIGQEVVTISTGTLTPGVNTFKLDLNKIPAGVYLYTLTSNGQSVSKKLVVSK